MASAVPLRCPRVSGKTVGGQPVCDRWCPPVLLFTFAAELTPEGAANPCADSRHAGRVDGLDSHFLHHKLRQADDWVRHHRLSVTHTAPPPHPAQFLEQPRDRACPASHTAGGRGPTSQSAAGRTAKWCAVPSNPPPAVQPSPPRKLTPVCQPTSNPRLPTGRRPRGPSVHGRRPRGHGGPQELPERTLKPVLFGDGVPVVLPHRSVQAVGRRAGEHPPVTLSPATHIRLLRLRLRGDLQMGFQRPERSVKSETATGNTGHRRRAVPRAVADVPGHQPAPPRRLGGAHAHPRLLAPPDGRDGGVGAGPHCGVCGALCFSGRLAAGM